MIILLEFGTCKEDWKDFSELIALSFALAGTKMIHWLLLEAMKLIS
jgi:hypothetical protein